MALNGTISAGTWTVRAETAPAPQGGFACRIEVAHGAEEARFTHAFAHHRTFESETEAVLEGLREGVLWIELKRRHAFDV